MDFRMRVKNVKTGNAWWESYEEKQTIGRYPEMKEELGIKRIDTKEDALKIANWITENLWNNCLSEWESPREVVEVELVKTK